MNFYSPLEQFEINPLLPISIFGIDLSYTNATLQTFAMFALAAFVVGYSVSDTRLVPTKRQSIVELMYSFAADVVKQQAGHKAMKYFPILFMTFIFVLFSNVMGLIPENFTVTSHVITTFTLSLGFSIGFLILSFTLFGIGYLSFFVPSEAPKPLLPLVVVIEVISYCLRPFSLAIRLFANMMAGHTLLYILSIFVIGLAAFGPVSLLPMVVLVAVVFLEIGIAMLQAYVFLVLLSVYLNDALNIKH